MYFLLIAFPIMVETKAYQEVPLVGTDQTMIQTTHSNLVY